MKPGLLQLFTKLPSHLKEAPYNFQSCHAHLGGLMPAGDGGGGAVTSSHKPTLCRLQDRFDVP